MKNFYHSDEIQICTYMVRVVFHSNDTCFPDEMSTVHNVQPFILDKSLQVWTNLYEWVLTFRVLQ